MPYTHPQHFGKKQAWHQHHFCYDLCVKQVKLPCSLLWFYPACAFTRLLTERRQNIPGKEKWSESERKRKRSRNRKQGEETRSYRVLRGCQNLLDHHTVSCEGAPVERVGPIRTEGAEATCYHATQRRGQQQVTGRGTRHKTKSKESITTCNLQGTTFYFLLDRESPKVENREKRKEPAVEQGSDTAGSYSEMEMRVRSVCLHREIEAERTRLKHYFHMKAWLVCITGVTMCV